MFKQGQKFADILFVSTHDLDAENSWERETESQEFTLELELDPAPATHSQAHEAPLETPRQKAEASQANSRESAVTRGPAVQPRLADTTEASLAGDVKMLSQSYVDDEPGTFRALAIAIVFGLVGAICFAGISAVYFSVGRRAGMLAVAFCAATGARMGASDIRAQRVRWFSALTAAGSAIVGKALLVLILFHLHPDFSAEDWMNFAEPGKSNAIYFEQGIENALSIDGDNRSGQEKLDEKFEEELASEDADSDEEALDEEGEKLSFKQVFPKLFDLFDLPLIVFSMIFAYRLARHGD